MSESSDRRAVIFAAVCACAMIANQVAGKAARDAIFLANFDVTDLPTMLIAASVLSIISVLLTARFMTRVGPGLLVPIAFVISALLFVGEFVAIRYSGRGTAVALYLQMAIFGAVLISGFWSLVNERFDPRTAKKNVGRIAGGATLGGLLGGVAAERVAATLTVDNILPLLAILHALCAGLILFLRVPPASPRVAGAAESDAADEAEPPPSGLAVLRKTAYLRDLAALVLLGTLATAALDYVFKAQAAANYAKGEDLLRFFAIFYTVLGVVTFLVQTTLNRFFLERFGLGVTIATLPAALGIGSLVSLAFPGLGTIVGARGAESTTRASLFRSGYELLYTPVTPQEKRATKTIIDVGFDRAGDALGGGMIRLVLLLAPAIASQLLLVIATILAGASLVVVNRLRRGYVGALEKSLLAKGKALAGLEIQDNTTRSTIMRTYGTLNVEAVVSGVMPVLPVETSGQPRRTTGPISQVSDPLLERIANLRSGDLARVQAGLFDGPLESALVPHIIPLLAWQEAAPLAVQTLRPGVDRHGGQLLDALLDQDEAFAVRRRLPRVLSAAKSPLVVAGLMQGLHDKRFEVRFQCGRALDHISTRHPEIELDAKEVFTCVLQEVKVDRRVWESRRLLDQIEGEEDDLIDDFLRQRSSRSLEHVFNVLALALPREPLQIAFRGLHTDDKILRGTALEYLESVLPTQIRTPLWPFLEADGKPSVGGKGREEILDSLLRSNESIQINLKELQKKLEETASD